MKEFLTILVEHGNVKEFPVAVEGRGELLPVADQSVTSSEYKESAVVPVTPWHDELGRRRSGPLPSSKITMQAFLSGSVVHAEWLWKEQWKDVDFDSIKKTWLKI